MTGEKYTLTQAAKELGIEYSERIYSVRVAAQRIGISESHLRRLLENGQLRGKKLGHDWVVLSLKYKRKRKPKERRI